MINYGVVLSGGGAKGAYQLGAWMALKELNISIIGVSGTSIGAINGALMVQDDLLVAKALWEEISINKAVMIDKPLIDSKNLLSLKNTEIIFNQLITNLKKQDIISKKEISALSNLDVKKYDNVVEHLLDNFGISTTPLKNKLLRIIDENKIRSKTTLFGLVVYNLSLNKGEQLFIEDIKQGKLVDYLLASSAFPGLKSVKINDYYYLDGGIHDNTPISMLIEKGIKDIIVVDMSSSAKINADLKDINLVHIKADNKAIGGLFEISPELVIKRINLGWFDTMKAFKRFKGEKYFFDLDDYYEFTQTYSEQEVQAIEVLAELFNIEKYQRIKIMALLEQVKTAYQYSEKIVGKLTLEEVYKNIVNSTKIIDDLLFIVLIKFNINNSTITKKFQQQLDAYYLIEKWL